MGFHVEINSILRSDEPYQLARGSVHDFEKTGSRVFFDTLPIWLTSSDWTARAEIRVLSQTRTSTSVTGRFLVLHVYEGAAQETLTVAFRRMFAAGDDPFIYLLMSPADYDQAVATGQWAPADLPSVRTSTTPRTTKSASCCCDTRRSAPKSVGSPLPGDSTRTFMDR